MHQRVLLQLAQLGGCCHKIRTLYTLRPRTWVLLWHIIPPSSICVAAHLAKAGRPLGATCVGAPRVYGRRRPLTRWRSYAPPAWPAAAPSWRSAAPAPRPRTAVGEEDGKSNLMSPCRRGIRRPQPPGLSPTSPERQRQLAPLPSSNGNGPACLGGDVVQIGVVGLRGDRWWEGWG